MKNENVPIKYAILKPAIITADKRLNPAANQELAELTYLDNTFGSDQELMQRYKFEFDNTKEGKDLLIKKWKTPPSQQDEWKVEYSAALLNYAKSKLVQFKRGGRLLKYQTPAQTLPFIFDDNGNSISGPSESIGLIDATHPNYLFNRPDYPSDEMVGLNQQYYKLLEENPEIQDYINVLNQNYDRQSQFDMARTKWWAEHPKLRDTVNKIDVLMLQMSQLHQNKRATIGDTIPGYKEQYNRSSNAWALKNQMDFNKQWNDFSIELKNNQNRELLSRAYAKQKDGQQLTPEEEKALSDWATSYNSAEQNVKYNVSYTPEEWKELNNWYHSVSPNNIYVDAANWTPMQGYLDHQDALKSDPRYKQMYSKYGSAIDQWNKEAYDAANKKQTRAIVTTASALPIAAFWSPMLSILGKTITNPIAQSVIFGADALRNGYNIAGSYLNGDPKSEENIAKRKNSVFGLGFDALTLNGGWLAKLGQKIASPRLTVIPGTFKSYIPNWFGKSAGFVLQHPWDLYNTGLGTSSAIDLLGTYTWNKKNYDLSDPMQKNALTGQRITDGVWMGLGALGALGLGKGIKNFKFDNFLNVNGTQVTPTMVRDAVWSRTPRNPMRVEENIPDIQDITQQTINK